MSSVVFSDLAAAGKRKRPDLNEVDEATILRAIPVVLSAQSLCRRLQLLQDLLPVSMGFAKICTEHWRIVALELASVYGLYFDSSWQQTVHRMVSDNNLIPVKDNSLESVAFAHDLPTTTKSRSSSPAQNSELLRTVSLRRSASSEHLVTGRRRDAKRSTPTPSAAIKATSAFARSDRLGIPARLVCDARPISALRPSEAPRFERLAAARQPVLLQNYAAMLCTSPESWRLDALCERFSKRLWHVNAWDQSCDVEMTLRNFCDYCDYVEALRGPKGSGRLRLRETDPLYLFDCSLADGAWPVRGAPALFGADLLRAASRTLLNYEEEMAEEHSEERSGVEVVAEAVRAEAVKAEAVKAGEVKGEAETERELKAEAEATSVPADSNPSTNRHRTVAGGSAPTSTQCACAADGDGADERACACACGGGSPDGASSADEQSILGESKWLLVGPAGSGTRWHFDPHGCASSQNQKIIGSDLTLANRLRRVRVTVMVNESTAYNVLFEGRKLWLFWTLEGDAPRWGRGWCSETPPSLPPSIARGLSAEAWIRQVLPRCDISRIRWVEQREGDVVYVPHGLHHLVLNLERSVAFQSQLINMHNALAAASACEPYAPLFSQRLYELATSR